MIAFVDEHRDRFSLERLCRVMSEHTTGGFLTPRGYRLAKLRPTSARVLRDKQRVTQSHRIHADNYSVYGVRKMWRAMQRAGWEISRDQTARLIKLASIPGVHRGRSPITAQPTHVPDRRPDLMERNFRAKHPHQLWVADITYVRTRTGFVYTAFVTDVFSRMIVGWSTRSTMRTEALPLEAS